LSITEDRGGKVLLKCQAGCSQEAVIEALRERGLWSQARPAKVQRQAERVVARYPYRSEDGTLLYEVERIERDDHKQNGEKHKRFRVRRPDGNGWLYNLNETPRALYRLPELAAVSPEAHVFVAEGERKVDRLLDLGLPATCNLGGAGKWGPEYSMALRGRRVVVLPDNDTPGRAHAEQVAQSLTGVAASVKLVKLPGLPEHGDIVDWVASGGAREQLERLVEAAPAWTPEKPKPWTGPDVTRRGDQFLFTWHGHGVAIGVDQLHEHAEGLSGELTVEATVGGTLHWGRLGLASTSGREVVVKKLVQTRDDVPWRGLLELVCQSVTTQWRAGEPVVLVRPRPRETVRSLIEPAIVLEGETAIVFGDGGAGKSSFAAALAAAVSTGRQLPGGIHPNRMGPVLYLDYEDIEETLAERLHGLQAGMGFPPIELVHYRRMTRSLASDIETIRAETERLHAILVIVDSITPAAGPDPEGADAATRTFNALRSVRAAKLVIAHLSKIEAVNSRGASRPWGSAFYWNLARSAWEFRRAADSDDGPLPIALYHRKSNVSRLHRPIGLAFEFADDGIWTIRTWDIAESPDLIARTNLSYQLRTLLAARGKLTVQEAAEELGSSEDVIRRTLNRERAKGKVTVFPRSDSKPKLWGLSPRRRACDAGHVPRHAGRDVP
jgi:hypothetical protein